MNQINTDTIKNLNAIPLTESKEWNNFNQNKKLKGRKIWWTFKQKQFTINYICPKTQRIWFDELINHYAHDTNAIGEMYLIP